jgi:hypothetical protein
MLFRFGTSPVAMIRSASGRIASTSSTARSPRLETRGAANRSVAVSMASRTWMPDGVGASSARGRRIRSVAEPLPATPGFGTRFAVVYGQRFRAST